MMKLSNIRLLVKDFEKSFGFYHETLGLNCTWGDKDNVYASFDIGLSSGLAIFKADLMEDALGSSPSNCNDAPNDKFAIVIEVENVDEKFEILQNKSVRFISQPKDVEAWGIRVAHLRDTEGNLIEIISNLSQ